METNCLRKYTYMSAGLSLSIAANADFAYKYFKRMWKPHYLDAHSGAGKLKAAKPGFFYSCFVIKS